MDPNLGSNYDSKCLIGVVRGARIALQVAMVAICIFWISWWFVSPYRDQENKNLQKLFSHGRNPAFFGIDDRDGFMFIFQTLPMIIATILAFSIIGLRSLENEMKGGGNHKTHKLRQWFGQLCRYPIWIGSPFNGVLTLGELIFVLSVLFVAFYHLGRMSYWDFQSIQNGTQQYAKGEPKSLVKLSYISYWFGKVALLPFSLLWIPVSRGSPFLRVIGVSFARAVKYHTWLGTLTIFFVGLHGVGYITYYIITNQVSKIFLWETSWAECSLMAGFMAWVFGLIIWVSSLPYIRRKFYECFYILHHFYILFLVFCLYHVVWTYHFFVIHVILFFIDRFIRLIQSRRQVDILSATTFESGVVKLNLVTRSKTYANESLAYNSLSTWCIQIPCLSFLQWHFFSTTSTQLDGKEIVSIFIKPLGGWTKNLSRHLNGANTRHQSNTFAITQRCPFSLKARIEGPYGDESNFYLEYKTLVLVSGGIGVTPLLAILRDVLHRYKLNPKARLPKAIHVYHCVRKLEDLDVLYDINPYNIVPNYSNLGLSIKVHAYLTSQSNVLPERINQGSTFDLSQFVVPKPSSTMHARGETLSSICNISSNGNLVWVACITISSILGYILIWGLENSYILKLHHEKITNYNQAHLIVINMLLGCIVFGGSVVFAWSWYNKVPCKSTKPLRDLDSQLDGHSIDDEIGTINPWEGDLQIGRRPIWQDVFDKLAQEYKNECVGVLVSGTKTMQEDIARECKRYSNVFGSRNCVQFDHHQVSFNL